MLILIGALGSVGACGGRQTATPCAPVADTLRLTADIGLLEGAFDVTMIATRGSAEGDTVGGTLRLERSSPGRRAIPGPRGAPDLNYHAPLFGSATLDVAAVGAVMPGRLDSGDEAEPGVLVIERTTDPRIILLRFGSEANMRDREPAFDGGYTVFQVGAMSEAGFRGSWRSGVTVTNAEGYFCAVRRND